MKLRAFLFVVLMSQSCFITAATMSAKISAVDNLWTSAQYEKGGIVPSEWILPHGLPVGSSIIPGSVATNASTPISLSNGHDSININVSVAGVQYIVSDISGPPIDVTGTANTEVTANSITVKGQGVGDVRVNFNSPNSMIKMYRPILSNITIESLKNALNNKPKGVYQGVIPYVVQYDYYRNDIRIRNTISSNIILKVDYNPAAIFNATIVTGLDGKLTPRYHGYPDRVVSAQGKYGVMLNGDFTSGLRVKVQGDSSLYTLKNAVVSDTAIEKQIAYSVRCVNGCTENTELIDMGVKSESYTQIDNRDATKANLELMVFFENKPYETLTNGEYKGQFRLLFEAQL